VTVELAILASGAVLISLASRRCRSDGVPWGCVPLFVASATGQSVYTVLIVAAVVVAVETFRRVESVLDVLPPLVLAFAALASAPPSLPEALMRLTVMFGLAPASVAAIRFAARSRPPMPRTAQTEIAASLVLLASGSLTASGVIIGQPLQIILGMAVPCMLPALTEAIEVRYRQKGRIQSLTEVCGALATTLDADRKQDRGPLIRDLHEAFRPYLEHSLTILALNPAYHGGVGTVLACPFDEKEYERMQERARHLFSSQADTISEAEITSPASTRHLHSGFPQQLLIPIRRDRQLIALLSFLGKALPLDQTQIEAFAESATAITRHAFDVVELRQRLCLLTQRAQDQGERLRHLLNLNQILNESSDLRSVTANLARAVCVGFDFGWCGILMRQRSGDSFRFVAAATGEGMAATPLDTSSITSASLSAALSLGTMVSRCTVVPVNRWPQSTPDLGPVEHLLVLSIGSADNAIGHVVGAPRPGGLMPDLQDLRALEILVDQVTPVVISTLHAEALQRQSLLDELTGIGNRRSLDHRLHRLLSQSETEGSRLSFAMIDADDFKLVNDRFGHAVGDVVLKELAQLLLKSVRTMDLVARYGGEEFCTVLPGLPAKRAGAVLERLRRSIAEFGFAHSELSHPIHLTVSMGLSAYPVDGMTPRRLIERADAALYRAKGSGKNRIVYASDVAELEFDNVGEPFPM